MLVLLSSGDRDRYLDDIVRSLALPNETDIQFRYSRSWISDPILDQITKGKIAGQKAIICYIDQSTNGLIDIVACRLARIVKVIELGSSLAVRIRVEKWPSLNGSEEAGKFVLLNPDCPKWINGKLSGKWFFEQSDLAVQESSDLIAWESVVEKLLTHSDFTTKKRDFFFQILGVTEVNNLNVIVSTEGEFSLAPFVDYELSIYHYQAKATVTSVKTMTLASSSKDLKLFSLPQARIDSRYDMKVWKFRCDGGIKKNRLVFEIRTSMTGDVKDDICQVELPATITRDWSGIILRSTLVAGGLGISSLTTLLHSDKWTVGSVILVLLGAAFAALGTIWKN